MFAGLDGLAKRGAGVGGVGLGWAGRMAGAGCEGEGRQCAAWRGRLCARGAGGARGVWAAGLWGLMG